MIVVLAVVLYAVFVLGGIQFFRQVHRWDAQALRMWDEELSRIESGKAQGHGRRRVARQGASSVVTPTITPTTVT